MWQLRPMGNCSQLYGKHKKASEPHNLSLTFSNNLLCPPNVPPITHSHRAFAFSGKYGWLTGTPTHRSIRLVAWRGTTADSDGHTDWRRER